MKSGPFNAVMDPTEIGAGSALLEVSEAAKKSGGYDVWATEDGRGEDEEDVVADVPVAGKKGKVKVSLFFATPFLEHRFMKTSVGCRHLTPLTLGLRSQLLQS